MRIVAGIMLIGSAVIFLLLSALFFMSSLYEKEITKLNAKAEMYSKGEEVDLSEESKDLVSPEELARMKQSQAARSVQKRAGAAGRKPLLLGALAASLALLQIVASVLVFLRRGRGLILAGVLLSLAGLAALMVLGGVTKLGGVAGLFMVVALGLVLLSWRGPRAVTT
jgi:hypothetical protein